jgi:hypothetical protein
MSNVFTRILRAADDGAVWPVPATTIQALDDLNERLDGAYAAEMHATQRAEQAEKELAQARHEAADLAAATLLLCACAAATGVEPADTPIWDQLVAEKHCELCGNWMPADELDGHLDRHDAETAPMTSQAVAS